MTIHKRLWQTVLACTVLALAVGAGLLGPSIAGAQDQPSAPSVGLAVSPPTFELTANPGDVLKNSLRVDNITDQSLQIGVEARNFTALGEEGGIDFSESEQDDRFSLASWMAVTPAAATLPARASQTFDYTITVPRNAQPGGRFGSIIFKTTAKPIADQSNVAIAPEIGALIFVKIAGDINEKASIASFGPANGFNENGPVGFDIRVKNEGNVQFKPSGTITISNFFGQKVATIPIEAQNVLPNATRKMSGAWDTFWLFGKYEATASVVYGKDRQILTATTTFWGFPLKLIGIILIGLAILAWLIFPRRARIARALKILFGRE